MKKCDIINKKKSSNIEHMRSKTMITINFYRFVPTLEVIKLKKDHKIHNVFQVKFDHECHNTENQLSYERARKLVSHWLEDHYGFCIIYLDNCDEWDSAHSYKICNHKKFVKDMRTHNLEVTIRGLNNVKV